MNFLERAFLKKEITNMLSNILKNPGHWKNVLVYVMAIVAFLTPSLQAEIVAHPTSTIAVVLSAILAALNTKQPGAQA
jgi:surface polysaccharide O-acyltransferase-like enzyme